MKKPALQNKRVGILLIAFRARKGSGTFEKQAPDVMCMFGHLFQNYDTIHVRFFATYTCNLFCYFPIMFPFTAHASVDSVPRKRTLNKHAYICAQQEPTYMRYKQTRIYGVIAGRCIRDIDNDGQLLLFQQSSKYFCYTE